jgi:drug/metabolite transporter (DMT)-like permease
MTWQVYALLSAIAAGATAAVVLGERITFRVAGGVALMIIGALLTLR